MRARFRTILIAVCTLGLLALFLRQANLAEVWQEIKRASAIDLVLSVAVTMSVYLFRAWRWQALLHPLGPTRFRTAFRTTVIGFAANSVLPARAGEVVRPYLLARQEGLSATSAFATIVLERLLDLATVLLLFGAFVLFSGSSISSADPALFRTVQVGGLLAGVGALLGLALVFCAAGHPERLGNFAAKAARFLPARPAHAISHAIERFAVGFAVMRHPAPLVRALVLSLPLWLAIALAIWFVARAFHITMSFTGTFLILALLTVGVAVPTPGAVGGFHYAFRVGATVFFGVPNERAVGAAIVLHAVSFLPVTLLGLFYMVQEGIDFGRLRHMSADASSETAMSNGETTGAAASKPTARGRMPKISTGRQESPSSRPPGKLPSARRDGKRAKA